MPKASGRDTVLEGFYNVVLPDEISKILTPIFPIKYLVRQDAKLQERREVCIAQRFD